MGVGGAEFMPWGVSGPLSQALQGPQEVVRISVEDTFLL